jgi:hypothetical protein
MPETYEGPKATKPHAEVRLERTFGNISRDRLGGNAKLGEQFIPEGEQVLRVAPGRARWTFTTSVFGSPKSASDVPVMQIANTPIAGCNLTHEYGFEAGRRYRLTYAYEGNNKCSITCLDMTSTPEVTPCN